MILGINEIHKLVHNANLLEHLSERELTNPEGAGIDLRIGELYEVSGKGFLGIDERSTPNAKLVARYDAKRTRKVILKPHRYYLVATVEEVNTPSNITALFCPRTTLFRSGVLFLSGNCSPGYRGKLTFGLMNLRNVPFELELGARVAHAIFHEVKGKSNLYRGQWQGGRVAAQKREKQV